MTRHRCASYLCLRAAFGLCWTSETKAWFRVWGLSLHRSASHRTVTEQLLLCNSCPYYPPLCLVGLKLNIINHHCSWHCNVVHSTCGFNPWDKNTWNTLSVSQINSMYKSKVKHKHYTLLEILLSLALWQHVSLCCRKFCLYSSLSNDSV